METQNSWNIKTRQAVCTLRYIKDNQNVQRSLQRETWRWSARSLTFAYTATVWASEPEKAYSTRNGFDSYGIRMIMQGCHDNYAWLYCDVHIFRK